MKRLILGVAAALILSAGQAAADGLPSKRQARAPVAEAGPNWNGFYIGAGIGAGAVVHELSDYYSSADSIGGEGIFGTVTVGYDRVIRPGWVAGVFTDFDFSGISSDFEGVDIDHEYSWSVGGRLGVLANPGTLLYGTAGYTQAEFDFAGATSPTFDGYFVGAGIETFLHQNWTLKLEYRFSQFDDENVFGTDVEPSLHTARLVLSYKFGHPHH
jgi:outer membrane immunogenic protein